MNSSAVSNHPQSADVPTGAPAWVTAELIDQTIRVWQPYYREELKPEDALAMILGVAQLNKVLGEGLGS
jgi:hypothetical protein